MQYQPDMKKIALVAGLAFGLGACVPQIAQYQGTEELKRNEVTMVRLKHTVSFEERTDLDAAEQAAIEDFLAINRIGYGDVLSLDLGDTGDPDQMADKWFSVYEYLRARGLHLQPEAPITGAAPAEGTGILIVERYTVSTPVCEELGDGPDPNWANATAPWYGCTTTSLLGLMVADPADLINGNPDGPPDAEQAMKGIKEIYRRAGPRQGGRQGSSLGGGLGGLGGGGGGRR